MNALRLMAVAVVALCLAATSACGSSAGSKVLDGKVTMGVSSVSFAELPFWVAESKGYFKDEGITVDVRVFKSGSDTLNAIVAGSIDITAGAYSSMLQAVAKHQDVIYVANMRKLPGYALVVSPKHINDITSLKDLLGKQVGVSSPGGETYNVLRYLMSKNDVPLDKVTYTAVGLTADAIAAMEKGVVPAAVMQDPAITQLEMRAGSDAKTIFDTRRADEVEKYTGVDRLVSTGIYANGKWATTNAKYVKAMVAAIVKAEKWIASATPDEIVDAMQKRFGEIDRKVLLAAVEANKGAYSTDGRLSEQDVNDAYAELKASQPDIGDIDLSKTYTNKYLP